MQYDDQALTWGGTGANIKRERRLIPNRVNLKERINDALSYFKKPEQETQGDLEPSRSQVFLTSKLHGVQGVSEADIKVQRGLSVEEVKTDDGAEIFHEDE